MIFSRIGEEPEIFYLENDAEKLQASIERPGIMEKTGYKIYRSQTSCEDELRAIMAFTQVHKGILQNNSADLRPQEISTIIEQELRVILNSVIFDPMTPIFSSSSDNTSIHFFLQNSIGRCFESLDWFSPLCVKGMSEELDHLFTNEQVKKELTRQERIDSLHFASLIERVMINDFHEFKDEPNVIIFHSCEVNFNRVQTFIRDQLWFQGEEIIQRDLHLNTPLHYLYEKDQEMDIILTRVFMSYDKGVLLPLTEGIIRQLMIKLIKRDMPLEAFHTHFIQKAACTAQAHRELKEVKEKSKIVRGMTINILQEIEDKDIPKKQKEYL